MNQELEIVRRHYQGILFFSEANPHKKHIAYPLTHHQLNVVWFLIALYVPKVDHGVIRDRRHY